MRDYRATYHELLMASSHLQTMSLIHLSCVPIYYTALLAFHFLLVFCLEEVRHDISANEILDTNDIYDDIMEADSLKYTRIIVLAAGGLIHYVSVYRHVEGKWEDENGRYTCLIATATC